MTERELHERLNRMTNEIPEETHITFLTAVTSGKESAPSLQYQTSRKAKGEEPVTRKISASAILVIALIVVSMTAALAAVLNNWGIINFAGNRSNAYIPPKYEDSITKENLTLETESITCTIQESYYDGIILRLTARIIPKTDALLISPGSVIDDPISDLFWQLPDSENEETAWESIGSVALREHAGHMAEVSLFVDADEQWAGSSHEFMMNEDGSYTAYLECQFIEEQTEIEVPLVLRCIPMTVTEELLSSEEIFFDTADMETTSISKAFRSVETKTFTCESPLEFPSVGVRIVNVVMTASPLEIRYHLDYEITDWDAYKTHKGTLWFDFIDPDSKKRLSTGLTSGGSSGQMEELTTDNGDDIIRAFYRQTDAIGLDALSDQYTITVRTDKEYEKKRYETITFHVSGK